MTKASPARAWRGWLSSGLLSLVLLVGCGPGVVGTGTGPGKGGDPGDNIPFTPGDVCTAPIDATALQCDAVARPGQGTAAVFWSDATAGGLPTVLVSIEGQDVLLEVPCQSAQFAGTWGVLADGTQGFVGRLADPLLPSGQAGVLRVTPTAGEPGTLTLWIADANGDAFKGPWALVPGPMPTGFAACGP